jgi:hypothetical protein
LERNVIVDPPGRGSLTDNTELIAAAADDFGHLVHRVPALVALPASASDVAGLVRHARSVGLGIVPRGAGHSVYGQAQSDGGIVCDLTRLDAVTVEPEKALVSACAGARWSAVLDAALARGLTPPVLPDYLELSIGGTLSVGGIGVPAIGMGRSWTRSGGSNSSQRMARFACARSSAARMGSTGRWERGSGGIITEAVLPVVSAPERVRVYEIPCGSVGELMAMQMKAVDRADYMEGQIVLGEGGKWQFIAELGIYARGGDSDNDADLDALAVGEVVSYRDFCYRMTPGVRMLAATGDWYRPHPWFSAFLSAGAVEDYVNGVLEEAIAETVGPVPSLLYPVRRGSVPVPGLETPGGDEDLFFAFSILRTTATDENRDAALQSNADLTQAAAAVGGTIYKISAVLAGSWCRRF